MPGKNKSKKRGGRVSTDVVARTPSQAFEKMLASRSDQSRLCGKCLTTLSSGSGGAPASSNINPPFLGVRPAAYAALFTRWRVNRLIVKFIVANSTALEAGVVGFLDDSNTSADVPTSAAGVLALRCSVSIPLQTTAFSSSVSTFQEYEWRPSRSSPKWFYTTLEGSSSDPRLEVPCSVFVAGSSATANFTIEIDYDITFDGACDVGSS